MKVSPVLQRWRICAKPSNVSSHMSLKAQNKLVEIKTPETNLQRYSIPAPIQAMEQCGVELCELLLMVLARSVATRARKA